MKHKQIFIFTSLLLYPVESIPYVIDQWKGPKHVVVLYVTNYTYLYHHIVVLDKYTHSSLVFIINTTGMTNLIAILQFCYNF